MTRPLEIQKLLFDIRQACHQLDAFTSGRSLEDYKRDPMLRSAVERQFEIIGEALSQAIQRDPALEKEISATRRIIAFRNRLIHRYASVADEVVWGILELHLPRLRLEIDLLLGDAEP